MGKALNCELPLAERRIKKVLGHEVRLPGILRLKGLGKEESGTERGLKKKQGWEESVQGKGDTRTLNRG